jgi:hypothetical protein
MNVSSTSFASSKTKAHLAAPGIAVMLLISALFSRTQNCIMEPTQRQSAQPARWHRGALIAISPAYPGFHTHNSENTFSEFIDKN